MTDETSCETLCTLPEDERRERTAALRRELLPGVKRTLPLADDAGVALEFDATPERIRQLEELISFERQCCGGLEWSLEADSRQKTLRLVIAGLAPDSRFFETLGVRAESVEAVESDEGVGPDAQASRGISRFATAGGLGVGAAFFLFCVVPIGLAAAGGATLAAWFAPLDHPAVVLLGGAAFAVPVWRRLRRRETAAQSV